MLVHCFICVGFEFKFIGIQMEWFEWFECGKEKEKKKERK
jgi:hypothetical protein